MLLIHIEIGILSEETHTSYNVHEFPPNPRRAGGIQGIGFCLVPPLRGG